MLKEGQKNVHIRREYKEKKNRLLVAFTFPFLFTCFFKFKTNLSPSTPTPFTESSPQTSFLLLGLKEKVGRQKK